jgi:hypothetical protein
MLLAATRMINKQDSRRDREKLLPLSITEEDLTWLAQIRVDSAKAHSEYMSKKHKGEGNPFYGKSHSAESNARRNLWTSNNNPMYDKKIVDSISGDNHYSKRSEHKDKHAGSKNGRYKADTYQWENIFTGEQRVATRLEMTQNQPALKSNISKVINGTAEHAKGWKIMK